MFRESEKHLKRTPKFLFRKVVDETEKEINYRSTDVFFKYFNECEKNKIARQSFHV
jgi:hypothetical protein